MKYMSYIPIKNRTLDQMVKNPNVQSFEEKLEGGKAQETERLSRVARRQTRSSEATPKMGGLR